jgi:hypothetical protein
MAGRQARRPRAATHGRRLGQAGVVRGLTAGPVPGRRAEARRHSNCVRGLESSAIGWSRSEPRCLLGSSGASTLSDEARAAASRENSARVKCATAAAEPQFCDSSPYKRTSATHSRCSCRRPNRVFGHLICSAAGRVARITTDQLRRMQGWCQDAEHRRSPADVQGSSGWSPVRFPLGASLRPAHRSRSAAR